MPRRPHSEIIRRVGFYILATAIVSLVPLTAKGQLNNLEPIGADDCLGLPCGDTVDDLNDQINIGVDAAVLIVVALSAVFFAYAGYKYVTSTGDESQAEAAKRQIIYAVIGITVALGARVFIFPAMRALGQADPGSFSSYLRLLVVPFINLALVLISTAATVYLIYAGFKYISARGDYEGAETARRQILYAVIGMVVAAGAHIISAAIVRVDTGARVGGSVGGLAIAQLVRGPVNVVLALAGTAAALYIIMAGIMYFSSQGDESQAEEAKRQIIYGIAGILVIALSAAIVNFVIRAII